MATAAPPVAAGRSWPVVQPALVRWVTFSVLAIFCGENWSRLISGSSEATMALIVVIALTVVRALALAARRRSPARQALAIAATLLVGLAAILAASGAPLTLLRIDHWGALVSQIGQGLGGLPDLRVPYRGADSSIRLVVQAGGGILVALAGVVALTPWRRSRSPFTGTLLLGIVYAVPAVEVGPRLPYLTGGFFAILVAAAMWGERLRRDQLIPGTALLGVCVLAAMAIGPHLDAQRPWVDYEHLADKLSDHPATFSWNHTYGPLQWSRQGRVMLRVSAPSSGYWKGVVLDRFDGLRWVGQLDLDNNTDTQFARAHKDWFETVKVVTGDISSTQMYAPGDVIGIHDASVRTLPVGFGTVLASPRPLGRGDSYTADVYSPHPDIEEMRNAGHDYPQLALDRLEILLPKSLGGPAAVDPHTGLVSSRVASQIRFPAWGQAGTASRITSEGAQYADAGKYLRTSAYSRTWALAQRLRAQSTSPYDLVRRVFARVRQGATYSENPPASRVPLEDFLFGHRTGYCQQFSGAMALLLRMAGVPARVASGFAPGVYDRGLHQYIVRDLDAHSWVEVYFPHIGWVPFDPTPASSPASSQAASEQAVSAATGDSHDRGTGNQPVVDNSASGGGGVIRWWTVLLLLATVSCGAVIMRWVRAQRAFGADAPADLVELVRALHRSGRPPAPQLTLASLEQAFQGNAGAQAYLRTLREARFAGRPGRPTPAQRAALRRDLGEGLGRPGWLRAAWALPPSPRQRLTQLLRDTRKRFYPR